MTGTDAAPLRTPTPYGEWRTPLTAEAAAVGRTARSDLSAIGGTPAWLERRPVDDGRQVVVRLGDDRVPEVATPSGRGVRTRVHEYGGGAWWPAGGGALVFSDQESQRLVLHDTANGIATTPTVRFLTPPDPAGCETRFADGRVTPDGRWFLCVREQHDADGDLRREIVAVDPAGSVAPLTIVAGHRFFAAPRPSRDGSRLAWLSWDHPRMPWDGTELWVADLVLDRSGAARSGIAAPVLVAGGDEESVGQPLWLADGSLVFVSDLGNWWQPYRWRPGTVPVRLTDTAAEFHAPDWGLGQVTMAELPGGSIACRMRHAGRDRMALLHSPPGGWDAVSPLEARLAAATLPQVTVELVDQPCVSISALWPLGDAVAFLGATSTSGTAPYTLSRRDAKWETAPLLPPVPPLLADDEVAVAEPFSFTAPEGHRVHGLLYLPASTTTTGPVGELPPLVVTCHGGPTGAAEAGFDVVVQFFVSRGLVVAAVDYRGSTGYGRAYRELLAGQWGVADVDDCVAAARHLAATSVVDGTRMAIRGSSAGGLTALGALVRSDVFSAAVSWYGVTDLAALTADTHDFESHYTDRLVGPWPEDAEEYRRRSPLFQAERITGSVLLLQGLDDPIVPPDQSARFAEVLRARGVRCTERVFEGESHGFRRPATIRECLTEELAFYGEVFGFSPTD